MWKKQASLNGNMAPKLVSINDMEFITVPYTHNETNHKDWCIQKYNATTNKWSNILTYQHTLTTSCNTVTFNKQTQEIYLFGIEGLLIKINIQTQQIKIIQTFKQFGAFPLSIIIDGVYHIIGGTFNNKHWIWNDNSQLFIQNHEFNEWNQNFIFGSLIYIEYKKLLLLFGGISNSTAQDSIWSYSIANNKWDLLDIELERALYAFGCVLSNDEQYIIILGGLYCDEIHVFNTDSMEFEDNDIMIECPTKNMFFATICKDGTDDEFFIFAYIRQYCDYNAPPIDVVKLVESWCNIYCIHMIEFGNSGNHWKIDVNHICDIN